MEAGTLFFMGCSLVGVGGNRRKWIAHLPAGQHPSQISSKSRTSPSKRTLRSHHINALTTLIFRLKSPCNASSGSASKNLAAYGRWHAARENAAKSYLDTLRLLLASGPRTETVR